MKIQWVVLLLVLFFVFFLINKIIYRPNVHKEGLNISNTRRIKTLDGRFYKAEISDEPILYKNVERLKNWAPMKWTPDYLTVHSKPFKRVYVHHKKNFLYYDEEKPMASHLLPKFFKNKELFSILKDKYINPYDFFLHLYQQNDQNDYFYFSQQIETLGENLLKEAGSMEFLNVTSITQTKNIWIGKSSITHIHYDASHNTFVQIYGKKKFLLYEPKYWVDLNLFSSLHPCHRQSQSESPILGSTPPFEVDLEPGDILYLPPFWFHHVIAGEKDISISINIWSDCIEHIKQKEISYSPIPIESSWDNRRKIMVVRDYLTSIIEKTNELKDSLFHKMKTKDYIDKLLIQRYQDPSLKNVFTFQFNGMEIFTNFRKNVSER